MAKKRKKGILLLYIAGGIILLLVLFRLTLMLQLNIKLNAIRAAGYPATLNDLNDFYPSVPDDENAANFYQQASLMFFDTNHGAFSKDINGKAYSKYQGVGMAPRQKSKQLSFRELVDIDWFTMILGEKSSDVSKAATLQFLTLNKECLAKLKEAVKRPKCRFNISLPEDFRFRYIFGNARKLFLIATVYAAVAGDSKLATENIITMLKFCDALDCEPDWLACWDNLTIQNSTVDAIEYTLSLTALKCDELDAISDALKKRLAKNNKLMEQSLAASRVEALNLKFYKTYPTDVTVSDRKEIIINYKIAHFLGFDILNKFKIITMYDDLFSLDKHNITAVKDYEIAAGKRLKNMSELYFLTKLQMQYICSDIYEILQADAKLKGALTGVTIERYRLKYQKLPKTLSLLVPEFIDKLPIDPFSGKPFRYVVGNIEIPLREFDNFNHLGVYEKNKSLLYVNGGVVRFVKYPGWMVYSFDKDLSDDRGFPQRNIQGNSDIPFRCVRR